MPSWKVLSCHDCKPARIGSPKTRPRRMSGALRCGYPDSHCNVPCCAEAGICLLTDEPKLPPKSHATLRSLEGQKTRLSSELSICIRSYNCHDKDRADDYMCTYACSIYDLLVEDYNKKVAVHGWRRQIADEAIRNTISCWTNYNLNAGNPTAAYWQSRLRTALEQHTQRKIWFEKQEEPELSNRDADWTGTTASMPEPSKTEPVQSALVRQRKALLEAYQAKTGASLHKIYTRSNSGIHKPEFYKWRDGTLPNSSATTINFERFLRLQKPPIRKPD